MWLQPVTVAPPAGEPVTLAEAKEYLRIDAADTSLDDEVDRYIAASRSEAERMTGTRLLTQSVSIAASGLSWLGMLPIAPIQSVTGITYLDLEGVEQTLAADQYALIGAELEQAIVPAHGVTWPRTAKRGDAVRLTAVVGYGDDGSDVPEAVIFALFRSIRAKMDGSEFDLAGALTNHRLWR